jgi:hypothetical protein
MKRAESNHLRNTVFFRLQISALKLDDVASASILREFHTCCLEKNQDKSDYLINGNNPGGVNNPSSEKSPEWIMVTSDPSNLFKSLSFFPFVLLFVFSLAFLPCMPSACVINL